MTRRLTTTRRLCDSLPRRSDRISGYGRTLAAAGRLDEARRYLTETAKSSSEPNRTAAQAALRSITEAPGPNL